ncbi:MAG TPA: TraB/GumN family protein [Usitatibacteraceae bacterium]
MPLPLTAFNRRLFALLAWLFLWSAAGAQTTDRAANYDPTQPAMATAVVAVPAAPPVESAHRAFIWEVSSPGNTVYLFGTIHVGKRSFYPLPEQVETALKKSAKLVVEADITKSENEERVRPLILYKPPMSLESQIPKALYQRLQIQLLKLKLPADGLRELKPCIAGGFLAIAEFTRLGYDRNFGVDSYLIANAQHDHKPVLELESQLGQLKMFDSMSASLQEAFLDNALTAIETGRTPDQVTGMVNAWQSGDAALMQEVTSEVNHDLPRSAEIEEALVYSRHPEMLAKIEDFLRDDQPYFVAIGSLHLVGPRGLVELLRVKGYKVRQL